jgi:DNA polymerase-3 subunit delta'
MPFSDFHGNAETVRRLREMLARKHFPHAVILSGARGAGKYTLALMLAQALNCLAPTETDGLPDFCGACANCRRIALAADLDARFAEAVEAREGLREADKKDTRLFVQTHPDVLVIPPDPPQMMIKVDQVRRVIETIYYRPSEARERVYIFTDSAFMKEAANSLLKVLEEPPEFATIFLLSENPGELLPTIRSRSMVFPLSAVPVEEVERYLAEQRPEWKPVQRALVARLSEGALGRARGFDVDAYVAARADALAILTSALVGSEHTQLFKITESYRAGAEGRQKTEQLLRTLYSLLRDLMFLGSGAPGLVQNTDIQTQLSKLGEAADFEWIVAASDRLAEVERGMRRNLLRSLSLDSLSLALEKAI